MRLAVVAANPTPGTTVELPFTTLTLHFSEAYDPATMSPLNLSLSQGTVTAATSVDATTIAYTIAGLSKEGPWTVTMHAGALTDTSGNPSQLP